MAGLPEYQNKTSIFSFLQLQCNSKPEKYRHSLRIRNI